MLNPHSLNGPEITTLLAALGLILNACIMFFISRKQSPRLPASDSSRSRRGRSML